MNGNWEFSDEKISPSSYKDLLEGKGMNTLPDLNYGNVYVYTHPKWDQYVIEIRFPCFSKYIYTYSFANYIELMNRLTPQFFLQPVIKEKKDGN